MVGFAGPVTYRSYFTRAMRTSPLAYRRAARRDAPAGDASDVVAEP
jgi:transcriptional regulator GlxA family with amidase domain